MREPSSISNSKKIICLLAFVALAAVTVLAVGELFERTGARNRINAYNKQRFEDFYALEDPDLFFIGSSHSYCTFDPEIFDEMLGTSSFQLGMPLQYPDASYYTLLEVFNHYDPAVVVVELYWDLLGKDFDMKQADTLFMDLKNHELQAEYFAKVFPFNEKVKYFMDTARYQRDFLNYGNSVLLRKLEDWFGLQRTAVSMEGSEYYRSKGYVHCDYIISEDEFDKTNQFKGLDGRNYQISAIQRAFVEKMKEECDKNGVTLLFVTAPVANVSMDFIENYEAIHAQVAEMCAGLGVPYLDYNMINTEQPFLQNEDFRDDAHLNHAGVEKVSRDYAERIREYFRPQ